MSRIENDNLIRKFMGYGKLNELETVFQRTEGRNKNWNNSWEWLMPVVEKIENKIGHAVEICQENCVIYEHESKNSLNALFDIDSESKIDATYKAVVAFIHWLNKQLKIENQE